MGWKVCVLGHKICYCKSTLNRHVRNIHGTRCDACKESKFAWHRQSDLVYGDGLFDKNLHGESETTLVNKFDFPRQICGLYDVGAPLDLLPSKSGRGDDCQSETNNDNVGDDVYEFSNISNDDTTEAFHLMHYVIFVN